jgi:cell division protein FtsB
LPEKRVRARKYALYSVERAALLWLYKDMRTGRHEPKFVKHRAVQASALGALLLMAGFVVAGPSGFLAWSENEHLLVQHQKQIEQLTGQRDHLRNRVQLLDPRHADPDLAGELLRSNLNVAHPDEMVMLLPKQP